MSQLVFDWLIEKKTREAYVHLLMIVVEGKFGVLYTTCYRSACV